MGRYKRNSDKKHFHGRYDEANERDGEVSILVPAFGASETILRKGSKLGYCSEFTKKVQANNH
jgi:hypothetical protein